ncbi:MAG: DUF4838 domain-containing protein [Armatimonadota bacterium]|nr:DUF4838 domain-containing protein [Armatimonadota bacterium]
MSNYSNKRLLCFSIMVLALIMGLKRVNPYPSQLSLAGSVGVGTLNPARFDLHAVPKQRGDLTGELILARNSQTDYSIVVPRGLSASAPEMTAARELQKYLGQVTGAYFSIVSEQAAKANGGKILIGQSRTVRRLLVGVDWDALGHDGIIIRTVGDSLLLAGGKPRGTLYAVYTFLEDIVGVRWWTSTESYIPVKKTLIIPKLDIVYKPKILYREAFYEDTNSNPLFAVKLRLNGHFTPIPKEYGGHYSILGWCHTFYSLLPPQIYFPKHPEWYSEINGKRTADWAQLCLSNEEMREELTRKALDWIRKNPDAGIISISQNDWHGYCQCAKCKAVDQEEGSPSGSLIRFINKVAEDIEKEFPNVLVETLAYQYTRKPPLHVKPRKNVVVRLCSIECNFLHPLDSDYNASFRDDVRKWAAIAPNLYIWNYVTDFAAYIQPHPNMRSLVPDIRFFAANNAIGVFEQGNPGCTIGDFDKLRVWVIAHALWNPDVDDKALVREFLNGYYGAAGPYLQRYLDLVHDSAENTGMHLSCYNTDLRFLPLSVMNEAMRLFNKAQEAVKNDPVLSARVRRERLVLDHVWLIRYHELKQEAVANGIPFEGPDDPMKLCKEFIQLARKYGNRNATEGQSFESYVPALEARFITPPTPEELTNLPSDDKIEFQESEVQLIGVNEGWVQAVSDPSASNGSAARMPGSHTQWATQLHITDTLAKKLQGKWRCYVVIRCETGDKGGLFQCGIYDANRGHVALFRPFAAKADESHYKTYYLGTHALRPGMYLWVSPLGDLNSLKAVYIDRFVLVKDEQK